jgi:hypothetical protein
VDHWGLTDLEAMELARCPYGVPRGRVAKGHNKEGIIYVLQGDDAPYPADEALKLVAKEMGLTGLLINQLLVAEFEQHETMIQEQRETVERILADARQRRSM